MTNIPTTIPKKILRLTGYNHFHSGPNKTLSILYYPSTLGHIRGGEHKDNTVKPNLKEKQKTTNPIWLPLLWPAGGWILELLCFNMVVISIVTWSLFGKQHLNQTIYIATWRTFNKYERSYKARNYLERRRNT